MPFKSQLNHYQRLQLSQVKYLSDMADAFQNRTKSVALRKEILKKNKGNETTNLNMIEQKIMWKTQQHPLQPETI